MSYAISASKAGRVMACPASANLELAIEGYEAPVEDRTIDNASNRGTNMHEIFAKLAVLPASEIKAMARVLEYIGDLRAKRRFKVISEVETKATWLKSEPKTTVDLVFYLADEIHVIDLKWGKIPVEVHDNEQLLFYAVTWARLAPKAKGVYLHIAQPHGGGMKTTFVSTTELKEFMDRAIEAEAKVLAEDVTFGPSDHCTFCPANPHSRGLKGKPCCPAMLQILYPPLIDEDAMLADL